MWGASQIGFFEEVHFSSGQNKTMAGRAVRLPFLFNFCIMEKFEDK